MSTSHDRGAHGGVAGLACGALSLCLFIAGTALALYLLDIGCVFKTVTGLSCPGCGMTRAWLAALRLDLVAAVAYHPLFWIVPPAIALVCAQGPCNELVRRSETGEVSGGWRLSAAKLVLRLSTPLFVVLLVALVALWVIRLLDPADAGLFMGGVVPEGVEPDVVGWSRPAWMAWMGA